MRCTPEDTRYHGLTNLRLKELLALHGLKKVTDYADGEDWVDAWEGKGFTLRWPLALRIQMDEGKIKVGETTYSAPCEVRVGPVHFSNILEPIVGHVFYELRCVRGLT